MGSARRVPENVPLEPLRFTLWESLPKRTVKTSWGKWAIVTPHLLEKDENFSITRSPHEGLGGV